MAYAMPSVPPSAAPSVPREPLAELMARLRSCGLRVTPGRRSMLATLLGAAEPLTLAQLQATIRPQQVPLATLFRSMLRMEEVGLVRRSFDHRGTTHWQLNLGLPHRFVLELRDTRQSEVLDEELSAPLRDLLQRLAQQLTARGYRELNLNVTFRALRPATQPRHVA